MQFGGYVEGIARGGGRCRRKGVEGYDYCMMILRNKARCSNVLFILVFQAMKFNMHIFIPFR